MTYATDDIIAEADAEIKCITHLINVSPLQYVDALWMKTLCCRHVFDESVLEGTFVKGLPPLLKNSMGSFWKSNKHAALQKSALEHESTSLTKLPQAAQVMNTSNSFQAPPYGSKSSLVSQHSKK